MNYANTMTEFLKISNPYIQEIGHTNLELKKNDKIKNLFGDKMTISLGDYNLSKSQRIEIIASNRSYCGALKKLFTPEEIEGNLTLTTENIKIGKKIIEKKSGLRIRKFLRNKEKELGNLYSNLLRRVEAISNSSALSGTLYASIDPREFLTCSYNTYGWTSCYSPSGEYNSAPILMINHPQSILFFIASKKEVLLGTEVYDKKWRCFVYCDDDCGFQMPALPFASNDMIKTMITDFLKFNSWADTCCGKEIKTDNSYDFMDDVEIYESIFYDQATKERGHILSVHNNYYCPVCGNLVNRTRALKCLCETCSR